MPLIGIVNLASVLISKFATLPKQSQINYIKQLRAASGLF
jgi:hypothetical protein